MLKGKKTNIALKKQVRKRVGKKKTRVLQSPYSNIDWEKASTLFQHSIPIQKSPSNYPSAKEILRVLAVAGAIGLVFAFPGAAPAIGTLVLGKQKYDRWQTKQVITRLHKQKYVKVEYLEKGKVQVKITKNGLVRALTYEIEKMNLNKPKRWDKKWRIVIFDIPETYKRVRDLFRMRLGQLGLYQLQESVYVSPIPCFDEIEFLRELYGIAFTVRYLLVENIEDDEFLKSHFQI